MSLSIQFADAIVAELNAADFSQEFEAQRFYLFPTNFHEGGSSTASVPITHWCEVVKTWEIRDLDALLRLESQVVFDRNTLETRYRFRPDQAIHVIAVRTYELPRPATVPMTERYEGCRSWVSLDEEIGIARVTEVRERFSVANLETVASGAQIQIKDRVVAK